MDENFIKELLRTKGKYLFHREGQEVEFKEQFNFAGLADYFRDFAAFANNRGGYLIFGVTDSPRVPKGLSKSSLRQFDNIDPEKIAGYLLEIFSTDIRWEQLTLKYSNKIFGIFYISEATLKPIIAKKDEGKEQIIKNGEVYYRYGGRTQKIQFAELENIINKRIELNNKQWLNLFEKIGRAGPQNAAILDTEKGIIEKDENKILVLDEKLIDKINFIKEGEFVEKKGSAALKIVGDIVPINSIEIIKKVKENLIKEYPLSATELVTEVKKQLSTVRQNLIWDAIRDNKLRNNKDYSAYVFRNKKQEDEFIQSGKLPKAIPTIYNYKAVDFLVKVLRNQI